MFFPFTNFHNLGTSMCTKLNVFSFINFSDLIFNFGPVIGIKNMRAIYPTCFGTVLNQMKSNPSPNLHGAKSMSFFFYQKALNNPQLAYK